MGKRVGPRRRVVLMVIGEVNTPERFYRCLVCWEDEVPEKQKSGWVNARLASKDEVRRWSALKKQINKENAKGNDYAGAWPEYGRVADKFFGGGDKK